MIRAFGGLSAVMLLSVPAAHADWMYVPGEKSAFGSGQIHAAISIGSNGWLGFRCSDLGYDSIFVTSEDAPDDFTNINAVAPKLKLRVDSGVIHELSVRVGGIQGKVAAQGQIDRGILEEVRVAKRRVSAAVSFGGMNFNEAHFSARGSTSAIDSLFEKCAKPATGADYSSGTGLADDR